HPRCALSTAHLSLRQGKHKRDHKWGGWPPTSPLATVCRKAVGNTNGHADADSHADIVENSESQSCSEHHAQGDSKSHRFVFLAVLLSATEETLPMFPTRAVGLPRQSRTYIQQRR